MSFTIQQQQFSGPLALLLDVLDKKELAITEVHLAEIANDYLTYIQQSDVAPEELADFLVIASRLIYLKSRELMPYLRIDEEEEGVPLEDQLRLYRLFADAAKEVANQFHKEERAFAPKIIRWKKQKVAEAQFLPAKNITSMELANQFHAILKRLEPFFALQEASVVRVKSVEQRIEELHQAIQRRAQFGFRDVVRGAKNKAEVVVSFLALLELVRQHVIVARQGDDNDIMIERV